MQVFVVSLYFSFACVLAPAHSLYPGDAYAGDNAMHIQFMPDGCSIAPIAAPRSTTLSNSGSEGGRLKILSSRGKQIYVAGCRWEPLDLGRLSRFTIDNKGPPTGRLEFRFAVNLRGSDSADLAEGRGDATVQEQEGDSGASTLLADYHFAFWMFSTLGAPTGGLLVSCGLSKEEIYEELCALVKTSLRVVNGVPAAPRVLLLQAIAVVVRGLRAAAIALLQGGRKNTLSGSSVGGGAVREGKELGADINQMAIRRLSRDLPQETWSMVRVLREAAIVQHAVELPRVGSQIAHFSVGLQALVEVCTRPTLLPLCVLGPGVYECSYARSI